LAKEISFKFIEYKGRLLENLVFIELKRKNKEIYYHKGIYEYDFVIKEGMKIKEALQICYELNKDNRKREYAGLLESMKTYKLKNGLIIINDQEDEIKINNKKIIIKSISRFLLEK
jgi:uncharacterized protein